MCKAQGYRDSMWNTGQEELLSAKKGKKADIYFVVVMKKSRSSEHNIIIYTSFTEESDSMF